MSPSAGKESPVWAAIENLQRGISWHRTKPFLIFEVRYFQATTLGLPIEISKYYESVNGITVNGEEINPYDHMAYDHLTNPISLINDYNNVIVCVAKAAVNPPLTERLGQLLTSEISLETDGFVG